MNSIGKFDVELSKRLIKDSEEACKTDQLLVYATNRISRHSEEDCN